MAEILLGRAPRLERGEAYLLGEEERGERFRLLLRPLHRRVYRLIEAELSRAVVRRVFKSVASVRKEFGAGTQPFIASGAYVIVLHTSHTHLAYALQPPGRGGAHAQRENFIIAVANPELAKTAPRYPRKLQNLFREQQFMPLDPPEYLNYEGTQLMLVRAEEAGEAPLARQSPEAEKAYVSEVFLELGAARPSARRPLFDTRRE